VTRRLRALRVLHPFPSLLNTALVLALAVVARGTLTVAAMLAVAMLALQCSIGAANDFSDEALDARTKPWKPIPAGLVAAPTARNVAVAFAAASVLVATLVSPPIGALAAGMLACGLVYDFWLKPTPWAWVCFSIAFALLPVYAWLGATGALPPRIEFVVSLAIVGGPAIQLSNGLIDLDSDRAGGLRTLAVALGRRLALVVLGLLLVALHALAWLTLARVSGAAGVLVALASTLALVGYVLSACPSDRARQAGWSVQAAAICVLGVGWLSAVS
jgi:4-hydroxybenzoate polyprenyltransferase